MKICLVSQEFPPRSRGGGIATQTFAKAFGLASLGHEITVLTAGSPAERSADEANGVRVIRIPGIHARLPIYSDAAYWLTYSTEVAVELAALNQQSKFDIIDFPEWGAEGFVHLLNRTEWNHTSVAVQIHGPLAMFRDTIAWPEPGSDLERLGSLMERTCLEKCDGLYSSSLHSADWCRRAYGLTRNIPVLHTGVDTDQFRPLPISKASRPTVLFAGRVDPQKGADTLFEACCLLAPEFPDVELRLIGRADSPLARQLQLLAAERGLPQLLTAPGFLRHEGLPEEFSRAHVFAVPSISEGGPGFVYLEAMACGLPAIACLGTGAAEAIVDGVTGFLVPPSDPEALAGALRSILGDTARRIRLGGQARSHVVETAERKQCILNIESYYQEILG